jgi:hypothetical protein
MKLMKISAVHDWQDLVSIECMQQFSFPLHKKVTVISGNDLNAKLFGIKHKEPESKEFIFYYFVTPETSQYSHRLFVCQHKSKCQLYECGRRFMDFNKLFDHLRSHTNHRPYPCTEPDCHLSFT